MINPVENFYNINPELEWNRLFITPYRRIEYELVHHYLSKYLPPSGRILDLGGGPGRYAIALAKQGYNVTLVDISKKNIQFAKNKIKAMGLMDRFDDCFAADARFIDQLADGWFDAVLCMGPLYHLQKLEERMQCLDQCYRVMKTNAPLFLTALPRLTYVRDALRSGAFQSANAGDLRIFDEIYEAGYSKHAEVPQIYFCHPDEVIEWFTQSNFDIVKMASCHGFAAFMDEQVNQAANNAEAWNVLIQHVLSTCENLQSLAMAEHLLAVGIKQSIIGEKEC